MVPGVLELEELDCPFDVRQSSPAEFEVTLGVDAARDPFGFHARLHPSHLADGVGVQAAARIAEAVDEGREPGAELGVAGAGAGAQEGLALPGVGPSVDVLRIGVQAAAQRPGAALGAQVGVRREGRLGAGLTQESDDLGGHLVRHPRGGVRFDSVVGLVEEDDVGVGGVAHLPAAHAPHGDDEVPAEGPVCAEARAGRGHRAAQGGFQGDVRGLGDGGPGGDRVDDAQGLAHRRAQKLPASQVAPGAGHAGRIAAAGDHRIQLAFKVVPGAGHELARVGQPRDRLGEPGELLGDVARGGQEQAEPLGGGSAVAQGLHVPVGAAHLFRQEPEGEQARVRLRPLGEPSEHDGKQLALDGRGPRHAGGQRLDVLKGAGSVPVADGLQAGLGRRLLQSDVVGRQPGGLGQERAVVDLAVEGADLAPSVLPQPLQVLSARAARHAHGPGQAPHVVLACGHEMAAAEAPQLDAVLEHPQDPVVAVEEVGVSAGDVPRVAQAGEGLEGRAHAQGDVGAPVDELEELDGEFDVPQAALAELELASLLFGGDVVFDAFAHRAGVLDEVLVPGGVPHHGPEGVEVGPPQFEVAGDGPGLQERLELPPLRPPFVVRHMRVERAHERAVLALGAQACVEHPQGRLVGGG